ncbi:MAG: hypothetical protein ACFFDI_31815 [Promethearchaeota archaeon]
MMYIKKNVFLISFLAIFFVLPLVPVSSEAVWSEDFEVGPFDDWYLRGYEVINDTFYFYPDAAPTITNGLLQYPNHSRETSYGSMAITNSTQAYGAWSFDFYVTPGLNHTPFCGFHPVSNLVLNSSGLDIDDPYLYGYYVLLGEITPDGTPRIDFYEVNSGNDHRIYNYELETPFTGSYHVEVTRDLSGTWRIYFDDMFLYSVVDNTTTTSERVAISNRFGDPAFDNITLAETFTDTHAPSITPPVHTPSAPNTSQTIDISVLIEDDYAVSSVEIYYRIDGSSWQHTALDHIAHEFYSGTIGPFSGATLEYYIKAVDTSSNEASSATKTVSIVESPTISTTTTTTKTTTTAESTPSFEWILLFFSFSLLVVLGRKQRR